MAINPDFAAFLRDQFEIFGPIVIRPMFGGAGIFRDDVMFGLIAYDTLYLKTGNANREDFERIGMRPFTYQGKSKPTSFGYYEVPADVLEDPREMSLWAEKAFNVALSSRKKKPARRRKTGTAL
jgi:DNA transformation protein and related proteins